MRTFIYHWLDGRQSFVRAESVDQGFQKLGYGGGAIKAVDFYSRGKLTHYFGEPEVPTPGRARDWIPFEGDGCFEPRPDMGEEDIRRTFLELFKRHKYVECLLPGQHKVVITRDESEYAAIGEIVAIMVYYCECCPGGWDEDDPNDHHYMGSRTIHFHLDQVGDAVDAAMQYVLGNKANGALFTKAVSLGEIAERLDRGFSITHRA